MYLKENDAPATCYPKKVTRGHSMLYIVLLVVGEVLVCYIYCTSRHILGNNPYTHFFGKYPSPSEKKDPR